MVKVPFWIIKGTYSNGSYSVYGKKRTQLPVGSEFAWYLKEYGYRSKAAAEKGVDSIIKNDMKIGISCIPQYTVEKIDVDFSEEDAMRFGFIDEIEKENERLRKKLDRSTQLLCNMVKGLYKEGKSVEEIAKITGRDVCFVNELLIKK